MQDPHIKVINITNFTNAQLPGYDGSRYARGRVEKYISKGCLFGTRFVCITGPASP